MNCARHDQLMKKNTTGIFVCSQCSADPFLDKEKAKKNSNGNDIKELNLGRGE